MNLFNYFWYFESALTPRFCDEVIKYALEKKDTMAITGGQGADRNLQKQPLNKEEVRNLKYNFNLINKKTWGDIYKPQEISISLLNIDPVDLRNSPDYTLLYGVKVDNCSVKICYDDNRKKGRTWTISLSNNKFIMFPSTQMYYIINHQKDSLNFIQTITYESL